MSDIGPIILKDRNRFHYLNFRSRLNDIWQVQTDLKPPLQLSPYWSQSGWANNHLFVPKSLDMHVGPIPVIFSYLVYMVGRS